MTQLYASVAAVVAFALLVLTGMDHALHAGQARATLAAQQLWPPRVVPLVHAALTSAELLIGIVGLASVGFVMQARLLGLAQAGALVLYLAFTVYGLMLLRLRPEAPCGCATLRRPVSAWTVARSMTLLGFAAAAAFVNEPAAQRDPFDLAMIALASLAFLVLLWRLPDAMTDTRSLAS